MTRPHLKHLELLSLDDRSLLARCRLDTFRGTGPGGQKRNKTESAVRLRLEEASLEARSDDSRSQHENKAHALKRLRLKIALELRAPVDVSDYHPSESLVELLAGRLGMRNARYPIAIAFLLDVVHAMEGKVGGAARLLGCTTGRLSRVITADPALLQNINSLRAGVGLTPLRGR